MVDAVHQEMQHKKDWLVREPIVYVEQEPMQRIFQNGPDEISEEETCQSLRDRVRGYEG